jgi:predicted DNA-binding transcriptional regulator AlpA
MIESTLSAREVAGQLKVSTKHLRTLVREGLVPQPVRFGACQRWPAAPFQAWLHSGCPACGPVKAERTARR